MLQPAGPTSPVRDRPTSLSLVFELLDEKKVKDFFIVETGCMRERPWSVEHWVMMGASTYIFDDFINYYDGEVASVDINPDNVLHAQKMVSERTTVYCSDSVEFLWNIPEKRKIDLLYLDSYDFEPENPIPSQKHHLKELTAVMKNLRKGSIIMVDDNVNTPEFEWFTKIAQGGKAGFVKEFMKDIGAELSPR